MKFFEKYKIQKKIFTKNVSRLDLLKVKIKNNQYLKKKINVWQNHNFDSLKPLMNPYLKYQNLDINFYISDYDDSLSFSNYKKSDLEIIFLDTSNFKQHNTASLLEWLY